MNSVLQHLQTKKIDQISMLLFCYRFSNKRNSCLEYMWNKRTGHSTSSIKVSYCCFLKHSTIKEIWCLEYMYKEKLLRLLAFSNIVCKSTCSQWSSYRISWCCLFGFTVTVMVRFILLFLFFINNTYDGKKYRTRWDKVIFTIFVKTVHFHKVSQIPSAESEPKSDKKCLHLEKFLSKK